MVLCRLGGAGKGPPIPGEVFRPLARLSEAKGAPLAFTLGDHRGLESEGVGAREAGGN